MKLKEDILLRFLDFNTDNCLLSTRNKKILLTYFKMLDVHNKNTLNDIQFYNLMKHVTYFKKKEIMLTFDMLDWNLTGEIGFDEFYMLVCILLCTEHHKEKHFIAQHSRTVFELIDRDGDGSISLSELQDFGFLFNLESYSLKKALHEVDFSAYEKMNYKDLKVFVMAWIDMQNDTKKPRGPVEWIQGFWKRWRNPYPA